MSPKTENGGSSSGSPKILSTISPTLIAFIALIPIVVIYASRRNNRKSQGYPPGPTGWPILGNLPLLSSRPKEMYLLVQDLQKTHGDIFSLYFGDQLAVFINSYDYIHKALISYGDIFSERPRKAMKVWGKLFNNRGLGIKDPQKRYQLKKTTVQALRNLGHRSNSLEEKIDIEVEAVISAFSKENGKPFKINGLALKSFANVICCIVLGKRFEYDDTTFNSLINLVYKFLHYLPVDALENFIPILSYINPMSTRSILQKTMSETEDIIGKFIDAHEISFDGENVDDVIDAFIKMRREDPDNDAYSDDNLKCVIHSLFMAAIESTQIALRWFFLYMIHHPDVQKKCQEEIDMVVGRGRKVRIEDREKMPYMKGTIMEILRHCNIAPLGAPRSVKEDIVFHGYNIPEGSIIFFNFFGVHMDEKLWDNPEEFKPERWIGEEGELLFHKGFISFSLGGRRCLGDQLARLELFLMTSSILQNFAIVKPKDIEVPSLKGEQRLSLGPKDYLMCAEPR